MCKEDRQITKDKEKRLETDRRYGMTSRTGLTHVKFKKKDRVIYKSQWRVRNTKFKVFGLLRDC
jgi:hypothetical protein